MTQPGREPLHVAHVCLRYPPAIGGIETYVSTLAQALATTRKAAVQVLCTTHGMPGGTALPDDESLEVTRCRLITGRKSGRYPIAPGILPALLRYRADVIHAHGMHLFTTDMATLAARTTRTPLALTPYYHPPRTLPGRAHQATIGRIVTSASLVLPVSRFEADRLLEAGLPARSMEIVPPAIRPLPPPDPAIWARLGVRPDGGPVILFVGRNAPHKRLDLLLPAFEQVLERHPDASLVLAGPGHGVELLQGVALQVHSRVHLAGTTSAAELAALYQGSSLLVLPSDYEAFGLVLLEAMSCGLPVIAAQASAPAELLAGWEPSLFPPGDMGALAARIDAILADGDLAAECSAWGRTRAATMFSPEVQARNVIEIYARCLR